MHSLNVFTIGMFLSGINPVPTPFLPNLMGEELSFMRDYSDLPTFFSTMSLQPAVTSTLTK